MNIAEKLKTIAENEPKVYDAGKKAEWSEFWDELQKNGERTGYGYYFRSWTDRMFYPKYDLNVVGNSVYMFYSTSIKNLKQRLIECGVKLDLSQATGSALFAYNYELEELPVLDLSNFQSDTTNMFVNCRVLHTIDKVILGSDIPNIVYTNWFTNCTSLKNIIIGAETKGERCSDLITMPFNEVFKDVWYDDNEGCWRAILTDSFASKYAEYMEDSDPDSAPGYGETIMCFETGERAMSYYGSEIGGALPSWFIPEDETENVSFYLCPMSHREDCFSRESIANDIDFRHCPLSRKSIGSVISALSSTASGKTLTLKKSAVSEALGAPVDDAQCFVDFAILLNAKSNWTIAYI